MSSYGSTHSGYIHPSQYTQHPQHQHHHQTPQPPYPTTPNPPSTSQPQAYFPPTPQQNNQYQQQQDYSTSPASHWHQASYPPQQQSTSLPHRRRSSSSHSNRPPFSQTAPIAIPTSYSQPGPPVYARSAGSHHVHDHHTYADGEDGVLDAETLREYEKRYAKDRELEKRPTLGGSVMSMFRVLGSSKRE